MVMPPGIEPGTCSLGESRSILLSYGTLKDISFNMPPFSEKSNGMQDFFS